MKGHDQRKSETYHVTEPRMARETPPLGRGSVRRRRHKDNTTCPRQHSAQDFIGLALEHESNNQPHKAAGKVLH